MGWVKEIFYLTHHGGLKKFNPTQPFITFIIKLSRKNININIKKSKIKNKTTQRLVSMYLLKDKQH